MYQLRERGTAEASTEYWHCTGIEVRGCLWLASHMLLSARPTAPVVLVLVFGLAR